MGDSQKCRRMSTLLLCFSDAYQLAAVDIDDPFFFFDFDPINLGTIAEQTQTHVGFHLRGGCF